MAMLARSKDVIASAKARLEAQRRLQPLRMRLDRLSHYEIGAVERVWRSTHDYRLTRLAAAISWLGNGLVYVLLGVPVLLLVPGALWPVTVACAAMLAAHLLYPWIKLACARERPCTSRTDLRPLIATLDRLSFPSGHLMTLTAACLPVLAVFPHYWPVAALVWAAMGWSRVACAHHYPSDVIGGTALGVAVAMPISWSLLG